MDKVVDFTNARDDSRIRDVATGTGKQAFMTIIRFTMKTY